MVRWDMSGADGGEGSRGRGHRMSKLLGRSLGVCTRDGAVAGGGRGRRGGDQLARGRVGAMKDTLQPFATAR